MPSSRAPLSPSAGTRWRPLFGLGAGIVAAGALAAVACNGPSYPPYDRDVLLSETATLVIVPGYEDAATASAHLSDATTALCAAPDATTLAAARSAWRDAFVGWRRTTAYQFGPAAQMNLADVGSSQGAITTAANETLIESNLASATPAHFDAAYVDALGGGSRGFHTLEYLLFAYPGWTGTSDDAMTLAALGDARRCEYATFVADHLARQTAAVRDAWSPAHGNFVATFTMTGGSNPQYSNDQAAVSALVGGVRDAVESTKVHRLGGPLGRSTSSAEIESPYAHASVASMRAAVDGAHDAWTVAEHSPDDFLRTRNTMLADEVIEYFDASDSTLAALESPPLASPFETYVAGSDHAAGDAAYDALGLLERELAGDVASTLGLSITSAADGD
ncbi:MAG: imelysin family protein [Sandaracinus sp.]